MDAKNANNKLRILPPLMFKRPKIRQPLGIVLLLVIIFVSLLVVPVQASSHLESRLTTLEFDNRQLRSRVDRLESQISPVNRPEPRSGRGNEPIYPSGRDRRASPASDPRVDRLATLAVELKERLSEVETQLAKLKSQVAP